jgi:hypothetical protein
MRYDEARKIITSKGCLDDIDWTITEKATGRSIAHFAAFEGRLPSDFSLWDMADHSGWTVAHVAAESRTLPSSFNEWGIAHKVSGWTVAHVAAQYGGLPTHFTEWGLSTIKGMTVIKCLLDSIASRNLDNIILYSDAKIAGFKKSASEKWSQLRREDKLAVMEASPEWFAEITVNSGIVGTAHLTEELLM